MKVDKFDFTTTGLFSKLFIDFINKNEVLRPFYSYYPDFKGFEDQMKSRHFSKESRIVLLKCLEGQYKEMEIREAVQNNIANLKNEKTFTVTTGHQLNIFTGPLYFIYKIVTVINTCKTLRERFPGYNFVPVYWMASEDHDFEEISYIKLFGQKYTWETNQTGAVGRMDPKSLETVLDAMPGNNEIFRKAYLEHNTLAEAVRYYVDELFGDEGLVVVDADEKELKRTFSPVVEDELIKNSSFVHVNTQSVHLEEKGYKPQINPREINLFYLVDHVRERIVREDNIFKVVGTELQFSEEEILKMVKEEPEKFSPNVILRPLYQEMILPNLAYVGGPAEVVYWLQLKTLFDHFQVPFPILLPRNFVLYIDHVMARKMAKTGAETSDVFLSEQDLIQKIVSKVTGDTMVFNTEIAAITDIFSDIKKKVVSLDPTLDKLVKAETKRAENSLKKIEKKVSNVRLRQHDDLTKQIHSWYAMIYPNGSMQERTDNFLNYFIDDPGFITKIKDHLDPLDLRYHVLKDEG